MKFHRYLMVALVGVAASFSAWGADVPTAFSNVGGITNTRHNMMQSTESINGGSTMNSFRNRYGEICVYCHTPHGADTARAAPLWNRALPTGTTYTTYNQLNTSTLSGTVTQPGYASLPCLSCHDGQQAIDAIINMPGSGQYSSAADSTTWSPVAAGYPSNYKSSLHMKMGECMSCHAPGNAFSAIATDFTVFNIGTDLRNDHPIGVTFPTTTGPGTDWNTPGGSVVRGGLTTRFFDDTGSTGMDKGDIRVYGSSGTSSTVECASCHDPHGVPSAGTGTQFNPTFLRKPNTGSTVCLTCHIK